MRKNKKYSILYNNVTHSMLMIQEDGRVRAGNQGPLNHSNRVRGLEGRGGLARHGS